MDNATKIPLPAGKQGAGMGNVPDSIVKPLRQIRGFGSGSPDGSALANSEARRITDDLASGGKQARIDGFSGGAVKGSKV